MGFILLYIGLLVVQMPMHVRISDFGLAKVLDNQSEYEASGGKARTRIAARSRTQSSI